jgi:hypothetical protein
MFQLIKLNPRKRNFIQSISLYFLTFCYIIFKKRLFVILPNVHTIYILCILQSQEKAELGQNHC